MCHCCTLCSLRPPSTVDDSFICCYTLVSSWILSIAQAWGICLPMSLFLLWCALLRKWTSPATYTLYSAPHVIGYTFIRTTHRIWIINTMDWCTSSVGLLTIQSEGWFISWNHITWSQIISIQLTDESIAYMQTPQGYRLHDLMMIWVSW